MAQAQTWTGKSGRDYTHWVYPYPLGQTFDPVPGNYVFARVVEGKWSAVYIGQTADLSGRFNDHHKMQCILTRATHIHAHGNDGGEQARRDEEEDLIANYNPPCNG